MKIVIFSKILMKNSQGEKGEGNLERIYKIDRLYRQLFPSISLLSFDYIYHIHLHKSFLIPKNIDTVLVATYIYVYEKP